MVGRKSHSQNLLFTLWNSGASSLTRPFPNSPPVSPLGLPPTLMANPGSTHSAAAESSFQVAVVLPHRGSVRAVLERCSSTRRLWFWTLPGHQLSELLELVGTDAGHRPIRHSGFRPMDYIVPLLHLTCRGCVIGMLGGRD